MFLAHGFSSVMKEHSNTTYTLGEAVSLTCTLSYGPSGTGPSTVSWTGIDPVLQSGQGYTIDEGRNEGGERTVTIRFPSPSNISYAKTYTCNFEYSTTERYTETVQLVVRCKCKLFSNLSEVHLGVIRKLAVDLQSLTSHVL